MFEPYTENRKQNQIQQQAEKEVQALRDSTKTTTQEVINMSQDQTRAIQHSNNALK